MCVYMVFFVSSMREIKRGFRSNFLNLINSVSTSIREIMSVKKPPKLSFSLIWTACLLFCFVLFFIGTYLNVKFSGSTTIKPRGLFFLITILSSKDLFNISIHKRCSPSNFFFYFVAIKSWCKKTTWIVKQKNNNFCVYSSETCRFNFNMSRWINNENTFFICFGFLVDAVSFFKKIGPVSIF